MKFEECYLFLSIFCSKTNSKMKMERVGFHEEKLQRNVRWVCFVEQLWKFEVCESCDPLLFEFRTTRVGSMMSQIGF